MVQQRAGTTVIIQPQPYVGKPRAGIYVSTLYQVQIIAYVMVGV
ncbi:MAG: hypothetical protein QXP36_04505 [Conexivisphaerales archaeon]